MIKWSALLLSLVPLTFTLYLWFNFEQGGGFQFEEHYEWIKQIGAGYHVGVDGVSTPLILLTGILTPLARHMPQIFLIWISRSERGIEEAAGRFLA